MKVLKFGGTSVGSPQRMKEVSALINDGKQKIVVLSAMSGTTNSLVEIASYLKKNNREAANVCINRLRHIYKEHVGNLHAKPEFAERTMQFLLGTFDNLLSMVSRDYTPELEKEILAQGELMSTNMVIAYLQEQGIKATLIPALDYMMIDENGEPDLHYIKEHLKDILKKQPGYEIYLTQGFITREIDNLQRGGSDYTACLIGAAVGAEEIQIWTDIDGMHNNDPRIVEHTTPVRQLNFEEAAELAYFGAKILHPTCIQPAMPACPCVCSTPWTPKHRERLSTTRCAVARLRLLQRRTTSLPSKSFPHVCSSPRASCARCLKSLKRTTRASTW